MKQKIGIGLTTVGIALMPFLASAQTIPTWSTTDTGTVVTSAATSFETTFVYVLQVMAPYAIIISLIVGLVWFFVRLARKH